MNWKEKFAKLKIGDTVKIIKRLPDNKTGLENWNRDNGDVGRTGTITMIHQRTKHFKVINKGKYYGFFSKEELEKVK